jgi:hypothetical protein
MLTIVRMHCLANHPTLFLAHQRKGLFRRRLLVVAIMLCAVFVSVPSAARARTPQQQYIYCNVMANTIDYWTSRLALDSATGNLFGIAQDLSMLQMAMDAYGSNGC